MQQPAHTLGVPGGAGWRWARIAPRSSPPAWPEPRPPPLPPRRTHDTQDPNIQRMTQAISQDPVFMDMARQLQDSLVGGMGGLSLGADGPEDEEEGGGQLHLPVLKKDV